MLPNLSSKEDLDQEASIVDELHSYHTMLSDARSSVNRQTNNVEAYKVELEAANKKLRESEEKLKELTRTLTSKREKLYNFYTDKSFKHTRERAFSISESDKAERLDREIV